jgi:hypothetical protein
MIRRFIVDSMTGDMWCWNTEQRLAWWDLRKTGISKSFLTISDVEDYVTRGYWRELGDPDLEMDEGL